MARARNIKPAFFQNDALGELDPLARLLFIGLWTIADYRGCLEFRPKRIKAQLLPYDECNVEGLAINLDKSGFIAIYSVQGQQYIKITNFERHQNPHKNERDAGSDFPDITQKDSGINELTQDGNTPDKNGTTPADSLLLIPDSPIPLPDPVKLKPESKPSAAGASPKKEAPEKKAEPGTGKVWSAYASAYWTRYGVEPVRNASVNGQLSQMVKRLGQDAEFVAAFYLTHRNRFYVEKMHAVGPMLADCEKLRTEWATCSQMTSTRATQEDRTQTNYDAFAPLIAEARAREAANG